MMTNRLLLLFVIFMLPTVQTPEPHAHTSHTQINHKITIDSKAKCSSIETIDVFHIWHLRYFQLQTLFFMLSFFIFIFFFFKSVCTYSALYLENISTQFDVELFWARNEYDMVFRLWHEKWSLLKWSKYKWNVFLLFLFVVHVVKAQRIQRRRAFVMYCAAIFLLLLSISVYYTFYSLYRHRQSVCASRRAYVHLFITNENWQLNRKKIVPR